MSQRKVRHFSKKKLIGLILSAILLIGGIGFLLFAADYYRAEDAALAILNEEGIVQEENRILLLSEKESDTALIFYPGAKVQGEAYLPLLDQIRDTLQITCILVHMPLHMAIFNQNAAEAIMEDYPEYETWYMAGHSMGGAMASSFAGSHQEEIEGLILMGAYVYGDYPPEHALTIYGSLNESVEDGIDYTDNIVVIEGGNHAQFGNYGPQKGDLPATISAAEQQRQTVAAIAAFIQ